MPSAAPDMAILQPWGPGLDDGLRLPAYLLAAFTKAGKLVKCVWLGEQKLGSKACGLSQPSPSCLIDIPLVPSVLKSQSGFLENLCAVSLKQRAEAMPLTVPTVAIPHAVNSLFPFPAGPRLSLTLLAHLRAFALPIPM